MSNSAEEKKFLIAHVIDPDAVAVKMLTMLLTNLKLVVSSQGFNEDPFVRTEDARPDFLIMELPGTRPPDFFEMIHKDRRFARTKFIICSANAESTEGKAYIRRLKPDRVFSKPLDASKFTREFKHLITLKAKQKGWKSSYG